MAEGEGGEKTEDASAKKLADARKEGQVGKSQEIPAVFVLLAGTLALNAFAMLMYDNVTAIMRYSFTFDKVPQVTPIYCVNLLYKFTGKYLATIAPVLAAVFIVALAANIFQVGFMLSWQAAAPKFSKIDPIKGFGQKFSSRSVVELLKAVLKIAIIGTVTYFTVKGEMDNIMRLWDNGISQILVYLLSIVYRIAIRVILVMLLLALMDFAFQKWKFAEDQKMTKQEVKDEYKQSEGDPQVKSRIRQLQQEAARKRMMQEVPEADVVVTNPTRLAVAIKYEPLAMEAPRIVAKGAGTVAGRIREIAEENDVPIVENRELARNLYKIVDVGEDVPGELYVAVAELLAYVYGLKGKGV